MSRGILFVLAIALCSAEGGKISPVQKVIQMIDDFSVKVQKDIDASQATFEEAAKFCDDEATAKGYAIKDSTEEIESLTALIEDGNAKLIEYGTNIEEASARISATEGELYDATKVRDGEHADFVSAEKELVDTVSTMEGAIDVLKKAVSMVQLTPDAKKSLNQVVAGLSTLVEASFVTHAQRQKVQAFLQAQDDAADNMSLSQTGATGTNAIVETVEEMMDKAEGTLADVRKEEMESNHAFMMLKQGLENEIKSNNEELNENTHAKQVTTEALAKAQNDLSVTQKALREDSAYLADLKRDCQTKAREWEAEHKDGVAEMTALAAAKAVLTKKFKVAFIEAKSSLRSARAVARDDDDAKSRALRSIEQLGRKLHSTALISLAYRAASDPFGKIRGMIEDMIAKLMQEAAEEATQKAFCDEELGTSNKSKDKKEQALEKTNARIEKAESATATLTEQVSILSKEISEIDSAMSEATIIRQKENSVFRVAEKDFSESQEACAAALEILREYYEGASLIEMDSSNGAAGSDGSGIIGLLEVAESDFAKLLAEARTNENAAADEFKKLEADNKLSKATKEVEVKGKEGEIKSLKVSLANNNEDKDGLTTELDAVLQYLNELKPQCEVKAPSYAEKKAKREAEIDGLKEGLSILEG